MALRVRAAGILMYNSHIESWGNESLRCAQLDEILADQARLADARTPVVIAGDFNNAPVIRSSLFSRLAVAAFIDALADHDGPRPTSIRHDHPLDWIFVRNLAPRGGHVSDARGNSDHHPVVATLAPGQQH